MAKVSQAIRFKATLMRPATPKGAPWTFLVLPKAASAKLPRRGMTSVEGSLNGEEFLATLSPDGQKSHWLKVTKKLRQAAGAKAGDSVSVEMTPVSREPEPKVPADLRSALAEDPVAHEVWLDITPLARLDWIHWITSAKKKETRATRIEKACDMLGSGKRQVCCFDRSGFFSKEFTAPEAG